MHIFLTGGTGFVGPPTLSALLSRRHTVLALARSDISASKLTAAGAQVLRGDISDPAILREGIKQTDGAIHIAWAFSISDLDGTGSANAALEKAVMTERTAIQTMIDQMRVDRESGGKEKALVVANGTLGVADFGRPATESDTPADDGTPFGMRGENERLVTRWSLETGVRAMTVRLSPFVHGEEDMALVPILGKLADQRGFVPTIAGRAEKMSPAVHKRDAAVAFCLAMEKGKAGKVYHAVAENVALGGILDAVARKKGVQVRELGKVEAMNAIGGMVVVMMKDNPTETRWTKGELGWEPIEIDLVDDIEANYFK